MLFSFSSSTTSPSFVRGVLRQEAESWQHLSQLYGPLVYGWARQSQLQPMDAEDVVQEVFRSVATGISRYRFQGGKGSFRRWLWGITRNKILDHYRQQTKEPRSLGGSDAQQWVANVCQMPPEQEPPSNGCDTDASLIHRAMGLLKSDFEPQTWQAFWRVAVDGQTAALVAEELGMTKKAVRQAKYRVLKRLRAELDE